MISRICRVISRHLWNFVPGGRLVGQTGIFIVKGDGCAAHISAADAGWDVDAYGLWLDLYSCCYGD